MKQLIEDNYNSIVKRGLITPNTTRKEFFDKLKEEVFELEAYEYQNHRIDPLELADVILVCFNISKHYNIDIEKELKRKIEINFNR